MGIGHHHHDHKPKKSKGRKAGMVWSGNDGGEPEHSQWISNWTRDQFTDEGALKNRTRDDVAWDYSEFGKKGTGHSIGKKDIRGWRKQGKTNTEIYTEIDKARREGRTKIGERAYSMLQMNKLGKYDPASQGAAGFGMHNVEDLEQQGKSPKQIAGIIGGYIRDKNTKVGAKAEQYREENKNWQSDLSTAAPFADQARRNLQDGKLTYYLGPNQTPKFSKDVRDSINRMNKDSGLNWTEVAQGDAAGDMEIRELPGDKAAKDPYDPTQTIGDMWPTDAAAGYLRASGEGADHGRLALQKRENMESPFANKPGNYFDHTVTHEFGHAMGLNHPHNLEDARFAGLFGGSSGDHSKKNTVMSYGADHIKLPKFSEQDLDSLWHAGYNVRNRVN